MPKLLFSWNAFSDSLVSELASTLGYNPAAHGEDPRAWLGNAIKRPNAELLKKSGVRHLIETFWLRHLDHAGVRAIAEKLYQKMHPQGGQLGSYEECLDFIRRCQNRKTFREVLSNEIEEFGKRGTTSEIPTRDFVIVSPAEAVADSRRPHQFQNEAWTNLSKCLAEERTTGNFRGLLVMPTGSGKTYTAVHWLMENIVNRGRKVLWVAHRHELLEQAQRAFVALANQAPNVEKLRIRIVSGHHCPVPTMGHADHILICSVASLGKRPEIVKPFIHDSNRFVVIDEAHHAVAKTYKSLIDFLDGKGAVLGLTATPTRTAETERPALSKLFGGKTIFEIEARKLIEQRFLATPIPMRVSTPAHVDADSTAADIQHWDKFSELSAALLNRIANLEERNDKIVSQLADESLRQKFGKTLIFAINVAHATLLTQQLNENGVCAESLTSYHLGEPPDGSREQTIARFQDPKSELNVLVNVQILTEGVDIPGVQTVFLARPTNSEILLRQMIGRALRGPLAGGTERAYVVSFEDHWTRFRDFESPLDLVPDIFDFKDLVPPEPEREQSLIQPAVFQSIPWDLIQSYAAQLRKRSPTAPVDVFEAVPCGWYLLEHINKNDDEVRQIVPVHVHQLPCWQALVKTLASMSISSLAKASVEPLFHDYFGDCDAPQPSDYLIRTILAYFRGGNGEPQYFEFAERRICEPAEIARHCWTADLGERRKDELIKERFEHPLAKAIYPSLLEFDRAVYQELCYLKNPEASEKPPRSIPVFDPLPAQQLAPGPHHDLHRLMRQTLKKGKAILRVERDLEYPNSLQWTGRVMRSWFGLANYGGPLSPGTIRINVLLDSPDVPESVMEFLLWHEYLHLYLRCAHPLEFRKLERSWPGQKDADEFLLDIRNRFDVPIWW